MNHAFLVVVVAALSGLAAQLALRLVLPHAGPILALLVTALALLVAAWRSRKPVAEAEPHIAGESLAPI